MLQRGLAHLHHNANQLVPLLASCSSSICSQLLAYSSPAGSSTTSSSSSDLSSTPTTSSSSSCQHTRCFSSSSLSSEAATTSTTTSSSSSSTTPSSTSTSTGPGFPGGVADFSKQSWIDAQRRRKGHKPYFNPDDGPEAYQYWEDMWRPVNPRHKRAIPTRAPLLLEADQQDALCQAAVSAGIPAEVVYGDTDSHELPRLIYYIYTHRPKVQHSKVSAPPHIKAASAQEELDWWLAQGGIPHDPDVLAARIQQLLELEQKVPGLDCMWIFKHHGFGVLSVPVALIGSRIESLGELLRAQGLSAEPGLVFTAIPKLVTLWDKNDVAKRVQQLPEVFRSGVGTAPPSLLAHPFQAKLLGISSKRVQQRLTALMQRYGKAAAAKQLTQLPQLLQFKPSTLDLKAAVLAQGLGQQDLALAKTLARRAPRLLTVAPETMQQRLEGIRVLLGGLDSQQLSRVVKQQPSLLNKSVETLTAKLAHLQETYSLSQQEAAALAAKHPKLLCYSTERLSAPLVCLQQIPDDSVLAPAKHQAGTVCLQQPQLLHRRVAGKQQDSLEGRLQLLQDLAGKSPAWRARVAELVGEGGVAQLAAVLHHSNTWDRLQQVLLQQQQQQEEEEVPAVSTVLNLPQPHFEQQYGASSAAAGSDGQ